MALLGGRGILWCQMDKNSDESRGRARLGVRGLGKVAKKHALVPRACNSSWLFNSFTDVLNKTSLHAGDFRRAGLRELAVWWGRQITRKSCYVARSGVLQGSNGGGRPGGLGGMGHRAGAHRERCAQAVCRRPQSWPRRTPVWEPQRIRRLGPRPQKPSFCRPGRRPGRPYFKQPSEVMPRWSQAETTMLRGKCFRSGGCRSCLEGHKRLPGRRHVASHKVSVFPSTQTRGSSTALPFPGGRAPESRHGILCRKEAATWRVTRVRRG